MPQQINDFDGLKYPVHEKPVNQIAGLVNLLGIQALDEREVKYLIYMYDQNSPMHSISDITSRKEMCADKSGFDVEGDDLEYLYKFTSPKIKTALVSILKDQHNKEYAALIAYEKLFYEYLEHLLEPLDNEDQNVILKGLEIKGKLRDQLSRLVIDIKEMRKTVFGDDTEALEVFETWTPEYVSSLSKRNNRKD